MEGVFRDLAIKIGGAFAIVGALIGGYLGYPGGECKFIGAERWCDSPIYGMVVYDKAAKYVLLGSAFGAVVGALIGLVVAWIWPQFAKDAGVNPP